MSSVTKNVAQYVNEKGINLSKMSRDTGIQYGKLYASLCDTRKDRSLRDDELVKVCKFLGINPMNFANKEVDKKC